MLRTTFRGRPVSEPSPWSGCQAERDAREPEPILCSLCEEERVSAEGEICFGCAVEQEDGPIHDTRDESALEV